MGTQTFDSYWKDKKILITGVTGFLGSELTQVLSSYGSVVNGFDLRAGMIGKSGRMYEGNVSDYRSVERAVVETRPDFIFHLAAVTQVVDARIMPWQAFDTNVMGTVNVLEAVRNSFPETSVIVASSDKAYGRPKELPVNEESKLNPVHPYDTSKACADLVAASYAGHYDLDVAVTRCGNIYGPGDTNWQRIIPGTIRAFLAGQVLEVRSDGTYKREYNYIADVIDAYLTIAKDLREGEWTGNVFNVSDPESVFTVSEVIEIISKTVNKESRIEVLGTATDEEKELTLDSSLIRKQLGWEPKMPFGAGIAHTVTWVRGFVD